MVQKNCGKCNKCLKNGDMNVDCDNCGLWFHMKCCKLNKSQLEAIRTKKSFQWSCEKCEVLTRSHELTSEDKINIIFDKMSKLDIIEEKVSKIDDMEKTLDFLSKRYDDFEEKLQDASKEAKQVKGDVSSVKNEMNKLKTSVKILNDERIRNELVIRRVQLESDEQQSIVDFVESIMVTLGLAIRRNVFACNLSKNGSGGASIFVKFYHHEDKMQVMRAKKNLKAHEEYKNLLMFDILGPETLELFNHAKLLKSQGYYAVFTLGSRVMAKMMENGRPMIIKDRNHVDRLLEQQLNRASNQQTEDGTS